MLLPELLGGLGNMMFQTASVASIAKQTGHSFGIKTIPLPPGNHSQLNYTETILKPLTNLIVNEPIECEAIYEDHGKPIDLERLNPTKNYIMKGFFQHTSYIEPFKDDVLKLFDIPKIVLPDEDAYFLHVRRGDFVNNRYHEFNLENYYKRAVRQINTGIAYVVSNDVAWCEEWDFLKDVRHSIVRENEVDTMAIMKTCSKGGIAANSSFSWWGLYLNTSRQHLIVPSRWFPHNYEYDNRRYHFSGATVLDV